jgi:hypothetical protein
MSLTSAVTVGTLLSTSASNGDFSPHYRSLPVKRASNRAARRGLTAVARCAPLRVHGFVRPLG